MKMGNMTQQSTGDEWVHKNLFCDSRGITIATFDGWKKRHLMSGVHYSVIGKTTLVNPEQIDQWIKSSGQQALDQPQTGKAFASKSTKKAGVYTRKRSPVTSIKPLTLSPR